MWLCCVDVGYIYIYVGYMYVYIIMCMLSRNMHDSLWDSAVLVLSIHMYILLWVHTHKHTRTHTPVLRGPSPPLGVRFQRPTAKETYYGGKRDLYTHKNLCWKAFRLRWRQKRPTMEAKETYYGGKRDLLQTCVERSLISVGRAFSGRGSSTITWICIYIYTHTCIYTHTHGTCILNTNTAQSHNTRYYPICVFMDR